ncbi:unnamed protein product [Sphagnum jensenii]|uniref:Uncharacterized protein n=1 Tax=Sphagnum jensenii TaxID=128206 RepID=A0ABP0X479_9BRYO
MADADVATILPDDRLEAVGTRKLKRLRKVKSCEEEVAEGRDDDALCNGAKKESSSVQFGGENRTRIDSAEEILKRFGKRHAAAAGGKENEGGDGIVSASHTKRKKSVVVQTKIKTAVVDMARESIQEERVVVVVPPVVDHPAEADSMEEEVGDDDEDVREARLSNTDEPPAPSKTKQKRSNGGIRSSRIPSFKAPEWDEEGLRTFDSETKSSVDAEFPATAAANEAGTSLDAEENMLEKARKLVAGLGGSDDNSKKNKSAEEGTTKASSAEIETTASRKKRGKKEERRACEELHAESQRLLRESKVAFTAPAPVWKPVLSVLEKIKKRRLELGCSVGESSASQEAVKEPNFIVASKEMDNALNNQGSSNVNFILNEKVEVELGAILRTPQMDENVVLPNLEVVQLPPVAVENVQTVDDATNDHDNLPGTPEIETNHLHSELIGFDIVIPFSLFGYAHNQISRSISLPNGGTVHSAQIIDSQDLLCYSQLSSEIEESPMQPLDENLIPRCSDGGSNKEKDHLSLRHIDEQQIYITATHVRALIDDEAEDEDEDLLAENVEEEEAVADEEELRDLIVSTEEEKVGDQSRRAALHRKWLQQQDAELTEDIMERLRTGRGSRWKGRDRVVSCLDEEDWLHDSDSDQNDKDKEDPDEELLEESAPEDDLVASSFLGSPSNHKRKERETKSLDDLYDWERCSLEVNNQLDDEEHDREILRQRLLEESEEQLSFLSPAEDESSREVFGLINKVNVTSVKGKATLEQRNDFRVHSSDLICGLKLSQPSFLGRSTSTSLPTASHKQGGSGGSRSFVFGRDDSNSSHGLVTQPAKEDQPANEAKVIQESRSNLPGHSKKEVMKPLQGNSECGPSLFDLLRRQAADLNKALQKKSTSPIKSQIKVTHNLSVFAFKSSRSIRGTRGS